MIINKLNFRTLKVCCRTVCNQCHTGAKILYLSKNPHFHEIHIFKISFFTKFTISKSHFSQNSHFQSLIFHKIHISYFSQNSRFSNIDF